jgi:acetyltransferase
MTVRNLDHLFRPESVGVVGAFDRPDGYESAVLANLQAGGFGGRVFPVRYKPRSLLNLAAQPQLEPMPEPPELAVLCGDPEKSPGIVAQLGAAGTRAAILACPAGGAGRENSGQGWRGALLDAARGPLLRLLGPGSAGLLVPHLGLNASFWGTPPLTGRIAFVSQSAAVTAAVLDWSRGRGIGFSAVVHLGEGLDVDLADTLDFLASDPQTSSILLHFEFVLQGRKFMSAARAAARNKPVVAIRPGRVSGGQRVATTRAGSRIEADDVYAAAMRRAGMVRVLTTEGLFEAVEALTRVRPLAGDRLAIVANGEGFGRIAADVLQLGGGRLAVLSQETGAALGRFLPAGTRPFDPLELPADAPPETYAQVLRVLLRGDDADAVLLIHAPTPFVPGTDIARAVCDAAEGAPHNLFTCWLGGESSVQAAAECTRRGVLSFDTPEKVVEVFLGIDQNRRNRALLRQTPPSLPENFAPSPAAARRLVARALKAGRDRLEDREAAALLSAYGFPVAQVPFVRSAEGCAGAARTLGFPVSVKAVAADPDGGDRVAGILSFLDAESEVRAAARNLRRRLRERNPAQRLRGFIVQPATLRADGWALFVGVATDPVFGPVILFGEGGSTWKQPRDCAVALPPLNLALARDLVESTAVGRRMAAGGAVDLQAVCLVLTQVSQLLIDLDEIAELEIDPLIADADGVQVREARVRIVAHRRRSGARRFAIRPYPQELREQVRWRGRPIELRPIMPEDEAAHGEFLASLDTEDVRYRFFSVMRRLPHSELARYTQIDYDREMAFVAVGRDAEGHAQTLGEVRAVADPDNVAAEFAIVVRSDLKGMGLGRLLLDKLIAYLRDRGTEELRGETMPDNERMKNLARDCGFKVTPRRDLGVVELQLQLRRAQAPGRVSAGEPPPAASG